MLPFDAKDDRRMNDSVRTRGEAIQGQHLRMDEEQTAEPKSGVRTTVNQKWR